jgi:ABC-type polysaccharide/polyol phosphate transport system ATPase subunit
MARESTAIEVNDVSKSFLLPHHRRTTVKEYFLHPFQRSTYEHQVALRDVSVSVKHGEFFGILGPNGSGKSTLMKIIARIYREDSGVVSVNGPLSPFIELGVGFNPELTARDNVRINGTLLGLSRSELSEKFDSIIGFAGLDRFVDQKLKNFSSGMQVRLAYSIAIQVPFEILLLDEVLAVGDAEFQEKCFATFHQFRAAGRTIVLVTHNLNIVADFADRAMLLLGGEVAALGDPDEVIAAYVGDRDTRAKAQR